MPDQLTTREQSILIKELGYAGMTNDYFYSYRGLVQEIQGVLAPYNNFKNRGNYVARPTLHQATDWLRSKGLHVAVSCFGKDLWRVELQDTTTEDEMWHWKSTGYPDHDTALSAGISQALTIIKERV